MIDNIPSSSTGGDVPAKVMKCRRYQRTMTSVVSLYRKFISYACREGIRPALIQVMHWLYWNAHIYRLRFHIITILAIIASMIAARRPRTQRQVVFVSDRLQIRPIKLAYALKEAGWQVILLHRGVPTFDASRYFAEIHQYWNPWEALWLAAKYTPIVYHVFSSWNFFVAAIFMRHKPGKIVFDNADLLTGMVREEILRRYPQQAELEQYCYANAEGLCCRDLRTQYLKRHLRYHLPKRILFPEYCWPAEKFQRAPKLTDGIHVVYAGNLELDPDSPVGYQYELAALLSQNRIHFHIYPPFPQHAVDLRLNMSRYLATCGNPDFVHIHDTIPPDSLAEELSKYHYGILISTKKVDYGNDHNTYYQHAADYFVAAKIFDYMDARLFTFTQNGRFLRFILEKHHNGKVVRCLEDIVIHCKHTSFTIPTIPQAYQLLTNIGRLTEFYMSLTRQ